MALSSSLAAVGREAPDGRLFSSFETWPDWLFYAPIVAYWVWLTIQYRGFLIMLTNPQMPLGGFTADLKSDWYRQLGPYGAAHTAPYVVIGREDDFIAAMQEANLAFPIVAKPDLGKNGTGVRIIEDKAALRGYMQDLAPGTRVVLQKYVSYENEAGVFYIRYPHEATGHIVSLTLKYFPRVTGDGVKTLRELIEADPRARVIKRLYFARHRATLDQVVPAGKEIRLVSVGNHCKGAIFKNGAPHVTPGMEAAFEKVAREMPEFYFGRFDVRFDSLESFKRGEDFYILEINGPGSEMTHVWDADTKLTEAYGALFGQYRSAWKIGAANRARGFPLPSISDLLRSWRAELALLATYTWEE